ARRHPHRCCRARQSGDPNYRRQHHPRRRFRHRARAGRKPTAGRADVPRQHRRLLTSGGYFLPTIGVLSAGVFGVFALSMLFPLLIALVEGNWPALEAIVLVIACYGLLATLTILSLTTRLRTLNRAGVFT